jgi:hypothetical protein
VWMYVVWYTLRRPLMRTEKGCCMHSAVSTLLVLMQHD